MNCKKFGKLHNPELGTPVPFFLLLFFKMANFASHAQMAELVDALDSKSGYRKVVQVRFLFWAQGCFIKQHKTDQLVGFLIFSIFVYT